MTKNSSATKGSVYNFISMISYAFYPAFIIVFGFVSANSNMNIPDKISIGFAIVAGKELFTFVIYFIVKSIKQKSIFIIFNSLKTHLPNKWGLLAIVAGALGGPIGYSLLTIGTLLIGASSPDAITLSFAIVVTLVLEKMFLKTKISIQGVIGIILVIAGSLSLVLIQASISGWNVTLALGVIFAFLAGIAWGMEAFMANWIIKNNKTNMQSEDFLIIKLSTGSTIAIVLMFLISWSVSFSNIGFETFSKFFTDWNALWKITIVGASMVAARFFFFKGVQTTSSVVTSTVVTLQIIILPIIIYFFYLIGAGTSSNDISIIKNYWFWLVAVVLFIGAIMLSVPDLYKKMKRFISK